MLLKSCDVGTLDYPISVGVRLLIFPKFSTQHTFIPYHTFINFNINFQPIRLFHTVYFSYGTFFAYFSLGGAELLHKLFQSVMIGQIYSPIYKNSENLHPIQYYSTPYVYNFWGFFHPIRLFHTIRLFFWSKCPPNTVIRYSRVFLNCCMEFQKFCDRVDFLWVM